MRAQPSVSSLQAPTAEHLSEVHGNPQPVAQTTQMLAQEMVILQNCVKDLTREVSHSKSTILELAQQLNTSKATIKGLERDRDRTHNAFNKSLHTLANTDTRVNELKHQLSETKYTTNKLMHDRNENISADSRTQYGLGVIQANIHDLSTDLGNVKATMKILAEGARDRNRETNKCPEHDLDTMQARINGLVYECHGIKQAIENLEYEYDHCLSKATIKGLEDCKALIKNLESDRSRDQTTHLNIARRFVHSDVEVQHLNKRLKQVEKMVADMTVRAATVPDSKENHRDANDEPYNTHVSFESAKGFSIVKNLPVQHGEVEGVKGRAESSKSTTQRPKAPGLSSERPLRTGGYEPDAKCVKSSKEAKLRDGDSATGDLSRKDNKPHPMGILDSLDQFFRDPLTQPKSSRSHHGFGGQGDGGFGSGPVHNNAPQDTQPELDRLSTEQIRERTRELIRERSRLAMMARAEPGITTGYGQHFAPRVYTSYGCGTAATETRDANNDGWSW